MPDEKALEAGRISRSLVTLWLNDQERELLDAIRTLVFGGDLDMLGYVLLEQATTTGELGILLAEERGATVEQVLQDLWLRHYGRDLGP